MLVRPQKGRVPEEAKIGRSIITFSFFTCALGAPMSASLRDAVSAAEPLCTHVKDHPGLGPPNFLKLTLTLTLILILTWTLSLLLFYYFFLRELVAPNPGWSFLWVHSGSAAEIASRGDAVIGAPRARVKNKKVWYYGQFWPPQGPLFFGSRHAELFVCCGFWVIS